MALEAGNEIIRCIPFVKEERLSRFLSHIQKLFEEMDLVLLLRIHVIVIKARLSDSHDFRICHDKLSDALNIFFLRRIGAVRMDARRAPYVMIFHKICDQLILTRFRAGQDAAHPGLFRIPYDLLRVREGTGEQVQTDIIIFRFHNSSFFIILP